MYVHFQRLALPLVLAIVLFGQATPVRAGALDDIDLRWKPELEMKDLIHDLPELPDVSVEVAQFRDTRFHHELIGNARLSAAIEKKENQQSDNAVEEQRVGRQDGNFLSVTTSDNVAEWVTENFADGLHDAGLKVVKSDGDVKISGEILQFTAVKGPDYNGDISIRIAVQKGDNIIWRGTASGWARMEDGDWDKGKGKRYCSVLSDSLLRAVASLLWYPHFRDALAGGNAQASQPETSAPANTPADTSATPPAVSQ